MTMKFFLRRIYHFLFALLAACWYRFPSRVLTVIGITGTKGKTTTVELVSWLLRTAQIPAAALSSVHETIAGEQRRNRTGNSMPGRFALQSFFARARRAGARYAVVEVTSQGILFHRHRFTHWAFGAATNIAPEHIEAHGSFEHYREAKASFLRAVAGGGGRVFLNQDDQASEYFFQTLPAGSIVSVSTAHLSDALREAAQHIPGEFNQQNIALAVAIARMCGASDEAIVQGLRTFRGVPGRFEIVAREPIALVVDYAHTPDSLEAAYQAAKTLAKPGGRLIAVLGAAGGGRDMWKRPVMGEIAGRLCDEIILTNEDPYDEQPEQIISDVELGVRNAIAESKHLHIVMDRREAIRKAIELARPGDVVICTGKGSETAIHVAGGKIIQWNEREIAEELLREK